MIFPEKLSIEFRKQKGLRYFGNFEKLAIPNETFQECPKEVRSAEKFTKKLSSNLFSEGNYKSISEELFERIAGKFLQEKAEGFPKLIV